MKRKTEIDRKQETSATYSFFISSKEKTNRVILTGQPDKTCSKSFIKLNEYLRILSGKLTESA